MKRILLGMLLILIAFSFLGCGDVTCTQCQGSGACSSCMGAGEIVNSSSPTGWDDCSTCKGSGACYKCMGTGVYKR